MHFDRGPLTFNWPAVAASRLIMIHAGPIVVQGLRDHRAKQRHHVTRPVTDCDLQFQVGSIVVDDETDEPFLSRRQRDFMSLTPRASRSISSTSTSIADADPRADGERQLSGH
jgi:hypothetical protein